MDSQFISPRLRLIVLGLLSGLCCALIVLMVTPLVSLRNEASDLIAKIAKHEQGLAKLDRRAAQGQNLPDKLIIYGSQGDISLTLQQSLSEIIRDQDSRLERMRQLPPNERADNNTVEIRVLVQWQGDLQSFAEILREIDALRPVVFTERLSINAGPRQREDLNMRTEAVFFQLWSAQEPDGQ